MPTRGPPEARLVPAPPDPACSSPAARRPPSASTPDGSSSLGGGTCGRGERREGKLEKNPVGGRRALRGVRADAACAWRLACGQERRRRGSCLLHDSKRSTERKSCDKIDGSPQRGLPHRGVVPPTRRRCRLAGTLGARWVLSEI